jgi:hypothetical protein
MSEQVGAEPEYHFKSFVGENFVECCNDLTDFVNAQGAEVTREQIISISAHELGVHDQDVDGEDNRDVELVLYYVNYREPSFQLLTNLDFKLTKGNKSWDEVHQDRITKSTGPKDIVAVTQTPKEVGRVNVIIEFFMPSSGLSVNHESFLNTTGNWDDLIKEVANWMGQHLYPHQVQCVSIYEDEHSLGNDEIRATVYYKDSKSSSIQIPEDIATPIFKYKLSVVGGEWDATYQSGVQAMAEMGVRETRCVPCTANKEEGNEKVQVIFHWDRSTEEALNAQARGGCCVIF